MFEFQDDCLLLKNLDKKKVESWKELCKRFGPDNEDPEDIMAFEKLLKVLDNICFEDETGLTGGGNSSWYNVKSLRIADLDSVLCFATTVLDDSELTAKDFKTYKNMLDFLETKIWDGTVCWYNEVEDSQDNKKTEDAIEKDTVQISGVLF